MQCVLRDRPQECQRSAAETRGDAAREEDATGPAATGRCAPAAVGATAQQGGRRDTSADPAPVMTMVSDSLHIVRTRVGLHGTARKLPLSQILVPTRLRLPDASVTRSSSVCGCAATATPGALSCILFLPAHTHRDPPCRAPHKDARSYAQSPPLAFLTHTGVDNSRLPL